MNSLKKRETKKSYVVETIAQLRKSVNKYLFLILLTLLLLPCFMLFSCSDSDDDNTPAGQAQIVIRSDPDPIPYTNESNGSYWWYFDYYVEEKAGIGATIVEWKYEMYTNSDELYDSGTHSIQNFIDWFTECDQTNGYINPNGTVCCNPYWCRSAGSEGFYVIESMRFIDDNNNEFWVTCRFTFLAVP